MKSAIIYYSKHHGNTKKLIDAIKEKNEVDLFDVTSERPLLEDYDLIGFASGIYYSAFNKNLMEYIAENLPENKDVFLIATCGAKPGENFFKGPRELIESKGSKIKGTYICNGFDTFGPFKLVGGIKKGHPTAEEINGAVAFYETLIK